MWDSERISKTAQIAEIIAADFYHDRLDMSDRDVMPDSSTWSQMPEVECVARLRKYGVSISQVRLFLTYIAAMDRARDANRLWNNGVELYKSHPQLFEPSHVAGNSINILRERLTVFGVSQRHGPDSSAWQTIAHSIMDANNPVSRAVYDGVGDARDLLRHLRTKSDGKNRFPLLRGPKIGPMWVRMLVAPGGAKIENMEIIPVAVDVHVARVSRNLIATDIQDRRAIQGIWRRAIATTKIVGPDGLASTSAALDPALWTFGKYGCSHCEKLGRRMPISRACDDCQFQA